MLAALGRRDFSLLWFGGLVSIAGDWVLYAALPYFVYAETGSTVATAGMIAAELAPGVLLGSVAGVFVDRWDRKRVLVGSNLLQAGVVALLLLVPLGGWLWLVYAVAAAQSAVAAFSMPAEGALIPALVEDKDLVAANALNALNNRLARLIGIPVGGTLLGVFGLQPVVAVDCATFVVAALLIAPIATPGAARASPAEDDPTAAVAKSAWASFWEDWLGGLRLVRRERMIALIFVVLGLMTFGGTMLDPLDVAWVRDVLGEGPQVYAWLITAHAASGIVGTLLVGQYGGTLSPRHLIGCSSVAAGAALAVKYNVPVLPLAVALSVFTGATSVVSSVGVETLVQRGVPDEYRGRVFGSLGASGALLSLSGAGVGGLLAEVVGIVTMLSVAAGLTVLAGLVVLVALAGSTGQPVEAKPGRLEPLKRPT
ncbi:MAG: MFS transporter [Nocardioidaceae bacterium]|nr:MFS transporter [Nocardioidaceae bacterium]